MLKLKFSKLATLAFVCVILAMWQLTYAVNYCQITLTPMENFKVDQFIGRWFEIQKEFELPLTDGYFDIDIKYRGIHKELSFTYTIAGSVVTQGSAVINPDSGVFKFSLFQEKSLGGFIVLDTDYNKSATIYACLDSKETGILFSLSRKKPNE